ncbi:calmodulin-lysine N-methyltransferase-like isoform X2 [Tubulanus polymorphus]|uniref:calmodulin-lysine N-methyltransferase-like isoform X2 n=1 Tax=Tubulanus polymorphus TaxID=672921 RepID=UPI003DA6062E
MPKDKLTSSRKAHQRWHILANVLKKTGVETNDNSASVRRFSSFGLLKATKIDENPCDSVVYTEEGDISWHQYSCYNFPNFKAKIRQLSKSLDISDLLEFDNTGNVCIWPAEEILAFYSMSHKDKFKNKSVCELGGGMTCLAGIAVAMETEMKQMVLTDGNEKSIRNLEEIITANKDAFKHSDVNVKLLRWDCVDVIDENKFDVIICADCLFFDDSREHLASAINKLLKPDFEISHPDLYDPDLHYPVLLTMTKLLVT